MLVKSAMSCDLSLQVDVSLSSCVVCFRVFDRDEDGLLSREEITRAAQALVTIQRENAEVDAGTEVKGEPAATEAVGEVRVEEEREHEQKKEEGEKRREEGENMAEVTSLTTVMNIDLHRLLATD